MNRVWAIRLARQAESDLEEILRWTAMRFGAAQAEYYAVTVVSAIEALHGGPHIAGVRLRNEIGENVATLHVARQGRKGRHFVVFRVADANMIEVLRLLHDSMDLPRHVAVKMEQASKK